MCIGILFVSLYIRCVSNSHGGQKRALEPLELELPLDAVNLTWILWKNSQFTKLLSHLSSPPNFKEKEKEHFKRSR